MVKNKGWIITLTVFLVFTMAFLVSTRFPTLSIAEEIPIKVIELNQDKTFPACCTSVSGSGEEKADSFCRCMGGENRIATFFSENPQNICVINDQNIDRMDFYQQYCT